MYFSSIFSEAASNIAYYNGEKIYSVFFLESKHQKVRIKYLSKKNDKQCIVLVLSPNTKYTIKYEDNELIPCKGAFPSIELYESVFGTEFTLDIEFSDGKIGICNGNEMILGNKTIISYLSRGHAMKIKDDGKRLKFNCNSDENSIEFGDLVFEVDFLTKN